ncbi:MAG: winged helix DNA-binding domain-containing protein [Melioribacteraceae bacterium]
MNHSEIASLRILNQQLIDSNFTDAEKLVDYFAAIQGQEYIQTKWGIGLRIPPLTDDEIEAEINSGKIVRTHLLRPTWHLVNSKDIKWLLMLTAPRVQQINLSRYNQLELDIKILKNCNLIIEKILSGGNELTRNEIRDLLNQKKINTDEQRLPYILMNAELCGIICSGKPKGKNQTYALIDERCKNSFKLEKDEALKELTKRYFVSRGPATIYDFSTWSGLTITDCKKGIEINKNNLRNFVLDNFEYYFSIESAQIKLKNEFILLPLYDEMIFGYKYRDSLFQYTNSKNIKVDLSYKNAVIYNNQIIGFWKRTINKKNIQTEFEFFNKLSRRQIIILEKAISRFGEFYNKEILVKILP